MIFQKLIVCLRVRLCLAVFVATLANSVHLVSVASVCLAASQAVPTPPFSMRVLKSNLTMEQYGSANSGAKLDVGSNGEMAAVEDLSVCIRVNFQGLATTDEPNGKSQIVRVADWKDISTVT